MKRENVLADYMALAQKLGKTPSAEDCGPALAAAVLRACGRFAAAAEELGLPPNVPGRKPKPVPESPTMPQEPREPESPTQEPSRPFVDLAAERRASLERQRKRREAEPRHVPMVGDRRWGLNMPSVRRTKRRDDDFVPPVDLCAQAWWL